MIISKKLFLIDAYSLIFKGYYSFIKNPQINSKGINTSAIIGFTNILINLIKKEKPTHIAVIFDFGASLIRKNYFPKYKSNRKKTPESIFISIPYIKYILKACYIPIIYYKGYEADDIIGTLAKKAEKNKYYTYIVTSDKDFLQLVTNYTKIYKLPYRGNIREILGVKEVCELYEIQNPIQIIDLFGIMGDPVDNIPGFPGIGKKIAKKLIKNYGNLENLLTHSYELKGKLKEIIEKNKELALISKKLFTIITTVPVELNNQKFLIKKPNKEKIKKIFEILEFKKILNQFLSVFY